MPIFRQDYSLGSWPFSAGRFIEIGIAVLINADVGMRLTLAISTSAPRIQSMVKK
jgi:hypothetical protein